MYKKLLIASILFISIFASSNLAWSAWVDMSIALPGDWSVDSGTVKLVLKVVIDSKRFADITINLYNFSIFGGMAYFSFSYDPNGYVQGDYIYPGQFGLKSSAYSDTNSSLAGAWWQTGPTKFAVDVDLEAFYNSLMTSLGSLGANIALDKGDYTSSLTGTISKDWMSIKGNYKLTVPFNGIDAGGKGGVGSVDLTGSSLSISGSYVATYVPPPLAASHASSVSLSPRQSPEKDLIKYLAETIKTAILNATKKK